MPKYIPLPPLERLNELFEVVEISPDKYGKCSGLVRKVSRGGQRVGSVAGCLTPNPNNPDRVDWQVKVDNIKYTVSRIIYYMAHGEIFDNLQIDHKDKNWLNNNTWNLRLDTDGSIQRVNTLKRKDNISGVVGVSWKQANGKWMASVRLEGRTKYLGLYTCKLEAARKVRDTWIQLGWDKLGRELPDLENISCDCARCAAHNLR